MTETKFNCLGRATDPILSALLSALGELSKLSQEQAIQITIAAADDVCKRLKSRPETPASRSCYDALRVFIQKSAGLTLSKEQVLADLTAAGAGDRSNAVATVIVGRMAELRSAVLDQAAGVSRLQLIDFDWKLKIAMSSDTVATLRENLVWLRLQLQGGSGASAETYDVQVELTTQSLGSLVDALTKAHNAALAITA